MGDKFWSGSSVHRGEKEEEWEQGVVPVQGRPFEIQQDAAQRIMAVLKDNFGDRFESSYLSISVDIKEMRDGIAQTLHNIPQRGE